MKQFVVAGLVVAAFGAHAVTLTSNGPVVNGSGLSVLTSPATTFGFGQQSASGNAVAEDFTVGGAGWTVESLNFYAYQTGSTGFTFTSATWSVIAGDVNTGTVVAGGTTAVSNGGLLGFRVTSTTLANTQRGIYQAIADVPDFALPAGSYWLRWGMTGTLASGPWQPPTSDAALGNAAQSITSGAFATLLDGGSQLTVTLPFSIEGTVTAVPEPGTSAMMLAGVLGLLAAARRRTVR